MKNWDTFQIADNTCFFRQIGPLKIWIKRSGDEWQVASSKAPGEYQVVISELCDDIPEDLLWYRYVLKGKSTQVTFNPIAPDRAVVVRPESALKIEAGAHARFYVLLPVWINISVGAKQKCLLTKLPTKVLSNTWFGEPHEGELCYYLKTWALRTIDDLMPRPHQAVCPVYIENISGNELDFNRLCIRTGFLSIYQGDSWLWTNKVYVQFRGVNQTSKIKYDTEPPDLEPSCKKIGLPRQKVAKEFSIKSFDNFKVNWLG